MISTSSLTKEFRLKSERVSSDLLTFLRVKLLKLQDTGENWKISVPSDLIFEYQTIEFALFFLDRFKQSRIKSVLNNDLETLKNA